MDMQSLPPEVWGLVLGNVLDSRDCGNAYKVSSGWQSLLEDSKTAWMFGQAFPFLFEYLPKHKILECRMVCRRWCYGVDHFLENNSYQRPVAEEGGWPAPKILKTDLSPERMQRNFMEKSFDLNGSETSIRRTTLLREAPRHPRCPLVGRSVSLTEIVRYGCRVNLMNTATLLVLGKHVWFLTITTKLPLVQSLQRILELLSHVPNLKTLRIRGNPWPHSRARISNEESISNFVDNFLRNGGGDRCPKFEALEIFIESMYHREFKQAFLQLIPTSHLQSLKLELMTNLPNVAFGNLVDLHLTISSERVFLQLVKLDSPIRRLSLELWDNISASILLGTVKHFGRTISNLELKLLPDYFFDCGCKLPPGQHGMDAFADTEILADVANLKRVVLKGFNPPSLNFLCGLANKVEYLLASRVCMGSHGSSAANSIASSLARSKLDLQEIVDGFHITVPFNRVRNCNEGSIYRSNVWSVFPKLTLLTVRVEEGDVGFWRAGYEKSKNGAYRVALPQEVKAASTPVNVEIPIVHL